MKFSSMIFHVSYQMVGKRLGLEKNSSIFFLGGGKGIAIFGSFRFIFY